MFLDNFDGKHFKRRYNVPFDLKVKQVCRNCNGGWMSTLESDVMNIILPIQNNKLFLINSEQQKLLATWAVKTAITIQYLSDTPVSPIGNRKWIYTYHTPPNTAVWIARFDGDGIATSFSRSLFIENNPNPQLTPDGQSVSFSIGSIIFVVLSIYFKNVFVRYKFPLTIAPHMFPIWPIVNTSMSWPNIGIDNYLRDKIYDLDWGKVLLFKPFTLKPI